MDLDIKLSPRRAIQSLSLHLLTRHEAERRPLPLEGDAECRNEKTRVRAKFRRNDRPESGHSVEQLLRPRLEIEPGILMGLVPGDCSDALHKVEDAFGLAALLG